MSAKAMLANYFKQQKQIFMPDLVVSTMDDLDRISDSQKKQLSSGVAKKIKNPSMAVSAKMSKPAISQISLNASKQDQNRLSTLRKVDTLKVAPRLTKNVSADNEPLDLIPLSFEQKREAMKVLFFQGCTSCHLAKTRSKMVFGSGNVDAPVMIIGEAPGEEENVQGLPFVGAAGQLLTQMLGAIKLDRVKDTFITNILKCHPPSNRNPESSEILACLPLLKKQIAILQPKAILLLGRIAAHSLLGVADSVSKMRSRVFDYNGIPCMVIYHPAALLHNVAYKRPAWEDLQKFKELLEKLGIHGSCK